MQVRGVGLSTVDLMSSLLQPLEYLEQSSEQIPHVPAGVSVNVLLKVALVDYINKNTQTLRLHGLVGRYRFLFSWIVTDLDCLEV